MTNKEKYKIFCENEKVYVPVFSQPWWMDAACGEENWDVYVVERGGIYVAAMPYYMEQRNGYQLITKAKNTQNNGILIYYPEGQKYTTKLAYEEKIIEEIISYIEGLGIDKYEQQFHYSFDNWLPFFWNHYKEVTRYTYVIEDTGRLALVEQNYTGNVRKNLKKSQKFVHLKPGELSTEQFYELNQMSFGRQGKTIPYSFEFVEKIYNAGKKNNSVRIVAAEDDMGNLHSAALLVWDKESVYYLLNGTNPEYKSSQANCFLIHESIKFAGELGKKFDFEGSVIKPIERAFREYGGVRKPYFRIYKVFNEELLQVDISLGGVINLRPIGEVLLCA